MDSQLRQHYAQMAVFLGRILGPDYEILLYDLADPQHAMVAAINSTLNGYKAGDPVDRTNRQLLESGAWKESAFHLNFGSVSIGNRVLRCSTVFIMNEEERPVGMFCVNFDDAHYRELNEQILKLCHPDAFLNISVQMDPSLNQMMPHIPAPAEEHQSPEELVLQAVLKRSGETGVKPERFSQEDKLAVVRRLEEQGAFVLKGIVKETARQLHSSQASVYRYISDVRDENRKSR